MTTDESRHSIIVMLADGSLGKGADFLFLLLTAVGLCLLCLPLTDLTRRLAMSSVVEQAPATEPHPQLLEYFYASRKM